MGVGSIIGAVTGGIGGLATGLAGDKNSKAISKASDATAAATAQALEDQRQARNQNVQLQQPFYNTGTAAMGQMNALLGLNVAPVQQSGSQGAAPAYTGPSLAELRGRYLHNGIDGDYEAAEREYYAHPANQPGGQLQPIQQPVMATQGDPRAAAEAAYGQFKNYTGYTTRLAEGNNALNSGYAAGGTLQSGDAMKAFAKYNQDFAANEFGQYANLLGGQQQLGAGAANALSGVNTNYANAASNLAIQGGQNIANTAVARANNFNGMVQGVASPIMNALGSFAGGGSSYGGGF